MTANPVFTPKSCQKVLIPFANCYASLIELVEQPKGPLIGSLAQGTTGPRTRIQGSKLSKLS